MGSSSIRRADEDGNDDHEREGLERAQSAEGVEEIPPLREISM